MSPNELLRQAQKYRAIGQTLPPNLPGPQDKAYYFAMAEELERQARGEPAPAAVAKARPVARPIAKPAPVARAAPVAKPPQQIPVHSYLALAVLSDRRRHMHRAFAIWLTLRVRGETRYQLDGVVSDYAQETDTHTRSVKRWIEAGDGVFWDIGQNTHGKTLWLKSKDKLFKAYNLAIPGRVLSVDRQYLLGKLQRLRATLQACWINKQVKWAGRETISTLTSVTKQTQLNYERHTEQRKQYVWALDGRTEDSDIRQLPNKYQAVFYPKHFKKTTRKRFGLYTPEIYGTGEDGQPSLGDNGHKQRVFFNDANGAVTAAEKRAKQGLWGEVFAVAGYTQKNNILVRTIGYKPDNH